MKKCVFIFVSLLVIAASCGTFSSGKKGDGKSMTGNIRLVTVDPGHFHAALVQKSMYDQVSKDVYVYAPAGPDLDQHLERINSYNSRAVAPTSWNEIVYRGDDFFERMLSEKKGNVVVLSGNNRKKAEYILNSVKGGMNVLADKPMIINPSDYPLLVESFDIAARNNLCLFDIMTERYEITTILQKLLSKKSTVFGTLIPGSEKDPSVTKISVHHFSKIVSGSPLKRPGWFFDTKQQGEGIVDVTTHLADLVQWECFDDRLLGRDDVYISSADRWSTDLTLDQFKAVTGLSVFPEYLKEAVKDDTLKVFSNGEFTYRLNNIWAKVSVEWKYQAPPGGGDTHYSVMRGSNCDLVIRQTALENFVPTLYIENIKEKSIYDFGLKVAAVLRSLPYDSLAVERVNDKVLKIVIPAKYRVGHEEHFAQVTRRFLEYMQAGKIPQWEVAAMLTKYYTTTSALKIALEKGATAVPAK